MITRLTISTSCYHGNRHFHEGMPVLVQVDCYPHSCGDVSGVGLANACNLLIIFLGTPITICCCLVCSYYIYKKSYCIWENTSNNVMLLNCILSLNIKSVLLNWWAYIRFCCYSLSDNSYYRLPGCRREYSKSRHQFCDACGFLVHFMTCHKPMLFCHKLWHTTHRHTYKHLVWRW